MRATPSSEARRIGEKMLSEAADRQRAATREYEAAKHFLALLESQEDRS